MSREERIKVLERIIFNSKKLNFNQIDKKDIQALEETIQDLKKLDEIERDSEINIYNFGSREMNINTKIGSKVIFSFPKNGNEFEQEKAKKYLNLEQEYTIENIIVGSWCTDIYLKEIPDVEFNSVQFSNVGETNE